MRENFVEVPLLQQREIEMKALGPVIRAFAKEFGEERTYDIVRRAMQEISRGLGSEMSKKGNGLEVLSKGLLSSWGSGGALEMKMIREDKDEVRFDVTKCDYAALYKELGFGDIGALISCDRDAAFLDGFDKDLELVRDKTIMAGDEICNFCYKNKKA